MTTMTATTRESKSISFLTMFHSVGEEQADHAINDEPTPIQAYPIGFIQTQDRWGRCHQAVSALVHQGQGKSATWHQASISPFSPGVPYSTGFKKEVQRAWNALFQGVSKNLLRSIEHLNVVQVTRMQNGGLHLKTTIEDMQQALEVARKTS